MVTASRNTRGPYSQHGVAEKAELIKAFLATPLRERSQWLRHHNIPRVTMYRWVKRRRDRQKKIDLLDLL